MKVLNQVISVLLLYIKIQQQIIVYLLGSLIGKHMARKVYDEPVNKPYRKLQVDQMPIIEYIKKLDYKKLLLEYFMEHGKQLNPLKPHKGYKNRVPNTVACPSCGAPHHYLYDNTVGKGQYK